MAEQSNSLPIAGLALVAAALLSGTLLAPQALDLLRPAERDRGSDAEAIKPEVDARLWEDPFAAVRRADQAQIKACNEAGKFDAALQARCVSAGQERPGMAGLARQIENSSSALVIAALVPGNPYVGAEEWRRRVRYALLKGLSFAGYVPHDAAHIQRAVMLLAPAQPPRGAGAVTLPYEPLDCSPNPSYRASFEQQQCNTDELKPSGPQAFVIWVDESALAPGELDALASLMSQIFPTGDLGRHQLRVLGPTTSQALRDAMQQLKDAAGRAARKQSESEVDRGYQALARAVFFNVSATAPAKYVLPEPPSPGDRRSTAERIGEFVRIQMRAIRPACGGAAADECGYVSTIGDDGSAAEQLAAELCVRGLRAEPDPNAPSAADAGATCRPGVRPGHRVALIGEWDSLYAQTLTRLFTDPFCAGRDCIESYAYLEGLDGVTLAGGRATGSAPAAASETPATTSAELAASKPSAVEWPESRDQRDYIRWLAKELSDSETADSPDRTPKGPGAAGAALAASGRRGHIDAIGLIGSDVHDKLLLLEALRREFPDRNIFTTDLDSRFLHPRALPFTRNLLVASTYPLQAGLGVPMRDVYQVSIFNAARLAAGDAHAIDAFRSAGPAPSVYVIGRTDAHCLPFPRAGAQQCGAQPGARPGAARVAAYGLLIVLVFGLVLVWPSTPSMHRLMHGVSPKHGEAAASGRTCGADQGYAFVGFSVVIGVALVWFLASCVEMADPGAVSVDALGAAIVISAVLLGTLGAWVSGRDPKAAAAQPPQLPPWWRSFARLAAVAAILTVPVLVLALGPGMDRDRILEPVFFTEGVSGWPSQLLRCLALILAAAALDRAWFDNCDAMQELHHCLGMAPVDKAAGGQAGFLETVLLRSWIFSWSYDAKRQGSFQELWSAYRQYARPWAHWSRIALGTATLAAAATVIQLWLDTAQRSSLPVRGEEHRLLMSVTQVIAPVTLLVCLVMVIDATLLAASFIWHLNSSRTAYPPEVLARAARRLGSTAEASPWVQHIRGDPANRRDRGASGGHSLLDNWIDVQVVAKLTEKTGSLLLAPFVVLALLLVARSSVFDNWAVTRGLAALLGGYGLLLIAVAVRIKTLAEQTRRLALESMNADLGWLWGAGGNWSALADQFRRMIDEVKENRTGAFAPLFNQPLVHALLLPLGGIGGSQLLDYFLLAR